MTIGLNPPHSYFINFFQSQNAYFSNIIMDESSLHSFTNLTKLREAESFQWGVTTVGTVQDSLWIKRHAVGFPGFVMLANLGTKSQTLRPHKAAEVPSQMDLIFHSEYKITEDVEHLDFDEKAISINPNQVLVFQFQ